MNKLRTQLLIEIITAKGITPSKYSNSYEVLKNIINLERNENPNFNKNILEKFEIIKKQTTNLHPKLKNIPLRILEEYFMRNVEDLNQFINIIYEENKDLMYECYDLTAGNLFEILENFFSQILELSILIADMYNIEIKFKQSNNNNHSDIF